MAKLSAADELTARAWLNDFLVMTGFKTADKDKRAGFTEQPYEYMQNSDPSDRFYANRKNAGVKILNELRKHENADLDAALDQLSRLPFGDRLDNHYNVIYAAPKALAGFIAWFCVNAKIYWDDLAIFGKGEEFFEKTMLGQAIKAFGATTSQRGVPTSNEDWPIVTKIYIADKRAAGEKGTHKYRQGQPPKDSYKSSGPQSGNARGLIGNPGEKIFLSDDDSLYCISANHKFAYKNPQLAFIRPLKPEGATADGKSNKVYFGSCNGYRECPIFILGAQNAIDMLTKMRDTGLVKPELDAVVIYELSKKAQGGYFKLSTEFGIDVLIKASKFNERLEHDDDEEIDLAECKQLTVECAEKPVAEKLSGGGYKIDPIAFSKMGHLSDN